MGLGKTVMTISLIISNPGRGGSSLIPVAAEPAHEGPEDLQAPKTSVLEEAGNQPLTPIKTLTRMKRDARKGGGTLIVCPMTLLGQWKVSCKLMFILFLLCIEGPTISCKKIRSVVCIKE